MTVLENATESDLAELVKGRLGVVIHTRATDRQAIRGPLRAAEVTALMSGETVAGVSSHRLWDDLENAGRRVIYLEDDEVTKLQDDAEVTRLMLDPVRVQSMRTRLATRIAAKVARL